MGNIPTEINRKQHKDAVLFPRPMSVKSRTPTKVPELLKAENPVAFFSNAIGDLLMTLPAFRALDALFPDRLTIVCPEWATDILESDIPGVRQVIGMSEWEVLFQIDSTFLDDLNNGIFSEDLRQEFEKNSISPSQTMTVSIANGRDHWKIGDKDTGRIYYITEIADKIYVMCINFCRTVERCIPECDLFLSLTPWYSADFDLLLKVLAPMDSVGLFEPYSKHVKWREKANRSSHCVDNAFLIPRYFNPSWCPENFAAPPVLPSDCERVAERWRNAVPSPLRVLAVHADTKSEKLWSSDKFVSVLNRFLERHPDFIAMIVGNQDLQLNQGRHGNRIYPCYDQRLEISLALVGKADVFLGVDSCMLHAADSFGIPGVGLFGPTDCDLFGFRFSPHHHICGNGTMDSISVCEVLSALESLVNQELRS